MTTTIDSIAPLVGNKAGFSVVEGAPIHVLSLGAGVQSSTLALMAASGQIGPMPAAAIFADTQAEPASVYRWLDWLEKQLPYPVIRATRGSLEEMALRVRTSKNGINYTEGSVPAFITDGQKGGLLMRQCTLDFKVDVIRRAARQLVGRKGNVVMWIGISTDEVIRMKPSRVAWIKHIWPLIENRISRAGCLQWMEGNGFPTPPRSSCVFCPYHSNAEWRRLRDEEPDEFARAVAWEKGLQASMAQVSGFRGKPFLHRSHVPLADVDLSENPDGQGDLFARVGAWGNECEGMCGV